MSALRRYRLPLPAASAAPARRRGPLWLVALLLSCSLAGAQVAPPGPATLKDDPEDKAGTTLLLEWGKPAAPAPAGYALAGYRVFLQSGNGELRPQDVITKPEKTETSLEELKPWRSYRAEVRAVYVPAGRELATDELVPTALATPGSRESAAVATATVRPLGAWFKPEQTNVLVVSLLFSVVVLVTIWVARRKDIYIRPIAGLRAVDDAIGRATEMGRPILYVAGLSGIGDISTIAAMLILGHLARRTAAYETPILVPCVDALVMAIQREIVHEAYLEAGKPDVYDPDNIFYLTDSQFGYVAAVGGIMMREKPAANFYMGYFYAESLLLAETGSQTGAIQIAGTDADTQLPFFVTSCDYTLMGEELYAAGAYLSRDPILLAQLKGQDIGKVAIFAALVVGTLLVTFATSGAGQWFLKLLEVQ